MSWQAILNALSGLAAQPWFQEFGHELMQWLLKQFLGTLPVTPQRLHALVDEFKQTKGIA